MNEIETYVRNELANRGLFWYTGLSLLENLDRLLVNCDASRNQLLDEIDCLEEQIKEQIREYKTELKEAKNKGFEEAMIQIIKFAESEEYNDHST